MQIQFTEINGVHIAELPPQYPLVRNAQDALDMMMNCAYQGATSIIIHQDSLTPEFFDLKTGIAGEILQKFSTYGIKLAIVGDFENVTKKSLKDFIFESNKVGRINFTASPEKAREALAK